MSSRFLKISCNITYFVFIHFYNNIKACVTLNRAENTNGEMCINYRRQISKDTHSHIINYAGISIHFIRKLCALIAEQHPQLIIKLTNYNATLIRSFAIAGLLQFCRFHKFWKENMLHIQFLNHPHLRPRARFVGWFLDNTNDVRGTDRK